MNIFQKIFFSSIVLHEFFFFFSGKCANINVTWVCWSLLVFGLLKMESFANDARLFKNRVAFLAITLCVCHLL